MNPSDPILPSAEVSASGTQSIQRRFQLQYAVAAALIGTDDRRQGLDTALQGMCLALQAGAGFLWLVDAAQAGLRCAAAWQSPSLGLTAWAQGRSRDMLLPLPAPTAPIKAHVRDFAQPTAGAGDPGDAERAEMAIAAGLPVAVVTPLLHNQCALGRIEFLFSEPQAMDDDTLQLLDALGRQVASFVGISADITARRQMEKQLALEQQRLRAVLKSEAQARQEAEEANSLQLKFLAMISHELRTPLTSIKGFATTLLAEDVQWDAASQREFVGIINSEADTLTELIDQLLDVSRLEAGLLRMSPGVHYVDSIVQAARPQLQTLSRAHTLSIETPANLPLIWADARRVAQVFTNLVSNAAKYSPPHTQIEVKAGLVDRADPEAGSDTGQFVLVSVSDRGPGIPQPERVNVFKPFDRGASRRIRNIKGTGLGLAICKGIVEAHGGRIWAEDRAGGGATLCFTLPVYDVARHRTGTD